MTTKTRAPAGPETRRSIFQNLEALVQETIGVRLFTLMVLDREHGLARRCYSNMPKAYPETGGKPISKDVWTETVIDRREPFVANTIEEIAATFADHELIRSLGCESCVNIPLSDGDQVIGTLNCLHEAGHYTPDRVRRAWELAKPGAAALLLALAMEETK